LLDLTTKHDVKWIWVRGHSTNRFNNFVDLLARLAILKKSGFDVKLSVGQLEGILAAIPSSAETRTEVEQTGIRLQDWLYDRQIPRKD
jgi:ribonuclease HI